jgi:Crp-like helix-turn-helix protein
VKVVRRDGGEPENARGGRPRKGADLHFRWRGLGETAVRMRCSVRFYVGGGVRLRRLVAIVEALSFITIQHRLASYLLREARGQGNRTARGVEFTFTNSNQELASRIGTVRKLVSRNLSRLHAAELIKLDCRTVIIPHLEALEAEVESQEWNYRPSGLFLG